MLRAPCFILAWRRKLNKRRRWPLPSKEVRNWTGYGACMARDSKGLKRSNCWQKTQIQERAILFSCHTQAHKSRKDEIEHWLNPPLSQRLQDFDGVVGSGCQDPLHCCLCRCAFRVWHRWSVPSLTLLFLLKASCDEWRVD